MFSQVCRRLDLGEKAIGAECRGELRIEDLERHVAIVPRIARQVDRRHAAVADLSFDLVPAGEGGRELLDAVHEVYSLVIVGRGSASALWSSAA